MSPTNVALLGLAVAVGAVVAATIYRRPQRGLLILAALTPLNGLLAIVPVGGLAGWKELLVAVTAVCAWLRRTRPSPRAGSPLEIPWWPAVAVMMALGIVSALAVFGLYGVVAIKVTFFYTSIVAILWFAPFDGRDRDNLVTILMVMGIVTSLVGVAQQIVGPSVLIELGYQYGQQIRTTGGVFRTFSTFNLPFPFALYVMLSLLVGGAVALAAPHRRRNLVFLCFTPIMAVAMTSSIVRASILGLLLGIVWLVAIRFRSGIAPLAGVAATVAVCLPFLPASVSDALFSSSSLNERNLGWSEILGSVFAYPFGRGLGSTGAAADRMAVASGVRPAQILSAANYQPDNYYVKMLVEIGPIGLWALIALLVTVLLWTTRLSRMLPGDDGALALGVSASIVSIMAASTVSTYFEIFPLDVYFWLLLGVVGCAAAQYRPPLRPFEAAWSRPPGARPNPLP
jgi:hypothetical protein